MDDDVDCSAVVLDVDGTLLDSTPAIERAWRAWAAEYGVDPEVVLRDAHGRRSEDTIRSLLPADLVDRAVRRQHALEMEDLGDITALPGARKLLARLAERHGPRWALATSLIRPMLVARMAAAGLPLPATVVTADVVTHGKPDPECYLLAARKLDVAASECLVIEDAPAGVIAAKAAGATVVAVTHTFPAAALAPDADFVINSLNQLQVTDHGLRIG
ncbi:MAG TPA: HAD-IA family hydrolase [Jatrophihabitans sp.]|jgi:sugar-phosphatase|nr:HAD-IA family hydrolase [Jatrophihabitans sp.]